MMNIQVIGNESGDYYLLEKDGVCVYSGHSIPNWVFYDLLIDLGANVETMTIPDKEMEEL